MSAINRTKKLIPILFVFLCSALPLATTAKGVHFEFSTLLGDMRHRSGGFIDIAVDADGFIYVVGEVNVPLATEGALQESLGARNEFDNAPFAAKLSPDGSQLIYLTHLAPHVEEAVRIVPAGEGEVFIVGLTEDAATDREGAMRYGPGGSLDIAILRLTADGSRLKASAYLGGSFPDLVLDATTDPEGTLVIAGRTGSDDFPTVAALDNSFDYRNDGGFERSQGFVARLRSDLVEVRSSTFIGGARQTTVDQVSVDDSGGIHIGGFTRSPDFPLVRPLDADPPAADELRSFAMKLAPGASSITFSTFVGTPFDQPEALVLRAVAAAPNGSTYVVASARTPNIPLANPLADSDSVDGTDFVWIVEDGRLLLSSRLPAAPGIGFDRLRASISVDERGRAIVLGEFADPTGPNDFLWGATTFNRFPRYLLVQRIDPDSRQVDRALSFIQGIMIDNLRFAMPPGERLYVPVSEPSEVTFQTTEGSYRNEGVGSAVIAINLSNDCMPRPGMVDFHLDAAVPVKSGRILVPCLANSRIITDGEDPWFSAVPSDDGRAIEIAVNAEGLADGVYRTVLELANDGGMIPIPITAVVRRGPWLPVREVRLRGYSGVDELVRRWVEIKPNDLLAHRREIALETSGEPWLAVSPEDGRFLQVQASAKDLPSGSYRATVRVTAAGMAPTDVQVLFDVDPKPEIELSAETVTIRHRRGDPPPEPVLLRVHSSTDEPLSATASQSGFCRGYRLDNHWLSIWPRKVVTGSDVEIIVQPRGMPNGTFEGSVQLTPLLDPTGPATRIFVRLIVEDGDGPHLEIPWDHVVNAASYKPDGIAPGQLSVVFAPGIGSQDLKTSEVDRDGRLATRLGDVRVLVNSIPSPLIYSAPGQVAFVAPLSLPLRGCATIAVEQDGVLSHPEILPVYDTPAFFSFDSSGFGHAAALNQDGTVNSPDNPAQRGEIVSMFFTGLSGRFDPDPADGEVGTTAPSAAYYLLANIAQVGFTTGGPVARSTPLYVGQAPTLVAGVGQVNVQVPTDSPTGPAVAVRGLGAVHEVNLAIE